MDCLCKVFLWCRTALRYFYHVRFAELITNKRFYSELFYLLSLQNQSLIWKYASDDLETQIAVKIELWTCMNAYQIHLSLIFKVMCTAKTEIILALGKAYFPKLLLSCLATTHISHKHNSTFLFLLIYSFKKKDGLFLNWIIVSFLNQLTLNLIMVLKVCLWRRGIQTQILQITTKQNHLLLFIS